jgi:membrane protease YdiL (CAAX protease family)
MYTVQKRMCFHKIKYGNSEKARTKGTDMSTWHKVLMGRDGLRAGWAVGLFLGLYSLLNALVNHLLNYDHALHMASPVSIGAALLRGAAKLVVVLVATRAVAKVMRRPVASYGYASREAGTRLWTGAVWGFGALSVLIGCLWATHHVVFDGLQLHGREILIYGLAWAVVFLMVGVLEESCFRGFLQHTLARGLGFWWAALMVSGAFIGWHVHNADESAIGLLSTGGASLLFCLSLWYTKSLWWAIGFHASWDWGQSFLYGTADSGIRVRDFMLRQHPQGNPLWSGGSVGPEGSLFLFPLLCMVCLGMWMWWGERGPRLGKRLGEPSRKTIPRAQATVTTTASVIRIP